MNNNKKKEEKIKINIVLLQRFVAPANGSFDVGKKRGPHVYCTYDQE
jgi:hypothetical protein